MVKTFGLSLCVVSCVSVPAVPGRPALHCSVRLQRRVGPGYRRRCGEHGTWSCAWCCASQHHRLQVRAQRLHSGAALSSRCGLTDCVVFLSPAMTWSSHGVGWSRSYGITWRTLTSVSSILTSSLWRLRSNREVKIMCAPLDRDVTGKVDCLFLMTLSLSLCCSWRVGAGRTETRGQSLPDFTASGNGLNTTTLSILSKILY